MLLYICKEEDFNPRSPHGERHAQQMIRAHKSHFNPRSPHGERHGRDIKSVLKLGFQSTLPARGATLIILVTWGLQQYFNPRSPHGERRYLRHNKTSGNGISIHAPRTGSDARRLLPRYPM